MIADSFYAFDAIGNRDYVREGVFTDSSGTQVQYTANALNQYTVANGVTLPTPAFDADGNNTNGPIPVATGNATLEWDAENRLVKVTRADSVVITYAYDYHGRRISKTVGGGTARHYFYEGWNPVAEYAGHTLDKTYLWGMDLSGSIQGAGGVGGLLAVKEGAYHYYPTFDGNGNVGEYLDAAGVSAAHYEYDAFGNTVASSGTKQSDFAHRFSTKFFDSESGFYYYGYRFYDPVTGRWPSRDPIEERGGTNLYGFVASNGINAYDYLGLEDSAPKELTPSEPCRVYEENPKHHKNSPGGGGSSKPPTDPVTGLKNSVEINEKHRVHVDPKTGEISVYKRHTVTTVKPCCELWHGHQSTWSELSQDQKNALIKSKLVRPNGNLLPPQNVPSPSTPSPQNPKSPSGPGSGRPLNPGGNPPQYPTGGTGRDPLGPGGPPSRPGNHPILPSNPERGGPFPPGGGGGGGSREPKRVNDRP